MTQFGDVMTIYCCDVFRDILGAFDWMQVQGEQTRLLPHIQTSEGKMKVNFCPSCGKSIIGIEVSPKEIEDSLKCFEAS